MIDAEGSRLRLVAAGVLRAPKDAPLEQRLARLAGELRGLLERFSPDTAAVEDVFVKVDAKAALAVGHGRGALLAGLGEAGIPVRAYPPASIKRAVAGNGRAGKEQVARMVKALLGAEVPDPADATDALATAITHALRLKVQELGT